MYLKHLSLQNFRNYVRLEMDFGAGVTVLQGENAQGKTNLLEAISYLSTTRSIRAGTEKELINWLVLSEPMPFARAVGTIQADGQEKEVSITLLLSNGNQNVRKQVRLNGVPRRAMDVVGTIATVLFLPQDINLVRGAPSERRRFLDVAICQIDHLYCRALSRYNKVMAQRNALLRAIREGESHQDELFPWDEWLVEHGSTILERRERFIRSLAPIARAMHFALSAGDELLTLEYMPGIDRWDESGGAESTFRALLEENRGREIAAGMSLFGPHRDDFRFLVSGRDLRTYGSRGQQRTAALALRLSQVEVMTDELDTAPLLLLDDVMSELDADRRGAVLDVLESVQQAIVTTTDWSPFTPDFLETSARYHVTGGVISPVEG